MLVFSILLAAMAPSPAAAVDNSRAVFTKCLRDHMKKSLEAKMGEAEYELALKEACGTERDAFRNAVIALDRADGDTAAEAAEDADSQIEDYRRLGRGMKRADHRIGNDTTGFGRLRLYLSPPAGVRGRGWACDVEYTHPAAASEQARNPHCPSRWREGRTAHASSVRFPPHPGRI
jgi:hypothetical protein